MKNFVIGIFIFTLQALQPSVENNNLIYHSETDVYTMQNSMTWRNSDKTSSTIEVLGSATEEISDLSNQKIKNVSFSENVVKQSNDQSSCLFYFVKLSPMLLEEEFKCMQEEIS